MSLLYQPISRTFGQRDGCLTPNNQDDKSKFEMTKPGFAVSCENNHDILSPPLSPYQKSDATVSSLHTTHKTFLETSQPFKIENYKSYTLTISPWSDLNSNYKQRQLHFLDQYSAISSKENAYLYTLSERRAPAASRKRNIRLSSGSDSESESVERVRTRRVVKEHLASLSEIDPGSVPSLPSPKKRKVKKPTSYAGSPLAVQQAALIDESIPDYSPDCELTLPKGNNRCLKIEWKGQPMDLRSDPNSDKLHPAEVLLASTLRLPCNVFLDSKRRLFYEKVNRMRSGMPFRRTDAQKACRIDVNKASRLFAAFEKVGWLKDEHFVKFC